MDTERKITFFIKPEVQKVPQLSLDEKFLHYLFADEIQAQAVRKYLFKSTTKD